jgi:hypothetical protein
MTFARQINSFSCRKTALRRKAISQTIATR